MKRYGRYLKCLLCNQDAHEDAWQYEDGAAWCPNCGELVPDRKCIVSKNEPKPRYPKEETKESDDD